VGHAGILPRAHGEALEWAHRRRQLATLFFGRFDSCSARRPVQRQFIIRVAPRCTPIWCNGLHSPSGRNLACRPVMRVDDEGTSPRRLECLDAASGAPGCGEVRFLRKHTIANASRQVSSPSLPVLPQLLGPARISFAAALPLRPGGLREEDMSVLPRPRIPPLPGLRSPFSAASRTIAIVLPRQALTLSRVRSNVRPWFVDDSAIVSTHFRPGWGSDCWRRGRRAPRLAAVPLGIGARAHIPCQGPPAPNAAAPTPPQSWTIPTSGLHAFHPAAAASPAHPLIKSMPTLPTSRWSFCCVSSSRL